MKLSVITNPVFWSAKTCATSHAFCRKCHSMVRFTDPQNNTYLHGLFTILLLYIIMYKSNYLFSYSINYDKKKRAGLIMVQNFRMQGPPWSKGPQILVSLHSKYPICLPSTPSKYNVPPGCRVFIWMNSHFIPLSRISQELRNNRWGNWEWRINWDSHTDVWS